MKPGLSTVILNDDGTKAVIELGKGIKQAHGPSQADRRCAAPDWSAVEQDYRTAGLSLRQLAAKHGCHHSSIVNRADRHGWTRSPAASRPAVAPSLAEGPETRRSSGSA